MRIDKFLKTSRIIKRRTIASEACSSGRVSVNQKPAKPSTEVKPGDIISIRYGDHTGYYEVLDIRETVSKEHSSEIYRIVKEDTFATE